MTSAPNIPLLPESPDILASRSKWRYRGNKRPEFAEPITDAQESVWDYPRPPAIQPCDGLVRVECSSGLVAETHNAVRVLETAGAPTIYIPPQDVNETLLQFGEVGSICEWKGAAQTIHVGSVAGAGWRYTKMFPAFAELYLWPSFYPGKLSCSLDGEVVKPQPGGYYGGWVTAKIQGPIKGAPNSQGW